MGNIIHEHVREETEIIIFENMNMNVWPPVPKHVAPEAKENMALRGLPWSGHMRPPLTGIWTIGPVRGTGALSLMMSLISKGFLFHIMGQGY